MKNKRRLNKKRLFLLLFTLFFLGLFIFSGVKILSYLKDNSKNKKISEKTKKLVVIKKENNKDNYIVDFKSLKKENPDTVAYLKVNNTNINYVVVKSYDNEYYLKHNSNKEWNVSGWIFADYHNRFDESDKNIVIYGHNTRDGSMFGTLKNTLEEDWQKNKENHKITLVTEEKTYVYEVFSTYSIEPEEYYINTYFNSDDEYNNFLQKIKARSNYNYDVTASKDDSILTLSSCTSGGKKRVVLHAKKVS